jgi:hypothetical protein
VIDGVGRRLGCKLRGRGFGEETLRATRSRMVWEDDIIQTPQFVTKTETYGRAYQILNGDNTRTPQANDKVMTKLITTESRGNSVSITIRLKIKEMCFDSGQVCNVQINVDI